MNIKKGDNVIVISGKERGKRGKVLAVNAATERLTVEGLNLYKKHKRPTKQGQKGEIVSVARSMNRSNVMLHCSSCKKGVRVGIQVSDKGKIRMCRTCKSVL